MCEWFHYILINLFKNKPMCHSDQLVLIPQTFTILFFLRMIEHNFFYIGNIYFKFCMHGTYIIMGRM